MPASIIFSPPIFWRRHACVMRRSADPFLPVPARSQIEPAKRARSQVVQILLCSRRRGTNLWLSNSRPRADRSCTSRPTSRKRSTTSTSALATARSPFCTELTPKRGRTERRRRKVHPTRYPIVRQVQATASLTCCADTTSRSHARTISISPTWASRRGVERRRGNEPSARAAEAEMVRRARTRTVRLTT
jgi:hypothetical protein